MKVTLWPGDRGGCAFHRIKLPAAICRANGLDIEILDTVPARRQPDGNYRIITQGIETDVLVIQRPVYRHIAEAIPLFQEDGITVIVEIDDDLHSLVDNHIAYQHLNPENSPDMNWNWFDKALEVCDFLTCTTRALANKYGREDRVAIIPNLIPKEITQIPYKDPLHTVGWTSNVASHPNDLCQTKGAVANAVLNADARVYIVGDPLDVDKELHLPDASRVISPGWVDHLEYYYYLQAIKVGIVPLEMSEFNQAKSNLKGLEYAAMGIPFVASPTNEYIDLASNGAGTLALTREEWYRGVYALLCSEEFRKEAGEQAKEAVLDKYLLEDNWHLYPEAWEKAWRLKNR